MSERCEGCGTTKNVGLMDLGKGMHSLFCTSCEEKALGLTGKTLEQLQALGDPLTPIQAALYDVIAAVDGIDASVVPPDPEMLERIRLTDGKILAHTAAFALIELRNRHEAERRDAGRL